MMEREKRLALINELAKQSSSGHIGRTALMKYLYFLQTLRRVPLGYKFSLYSYGPFDSDVLSDLDRAETMGVVSTEPVVFSGGYGYRIRAGKKVSTVGPGALKFVKDSKQDVRWILEKFGGFSAAELELTSTIIYVDRESLRGGEKNSLARLAKSVNEIKPHFDTNKILEYATTLQKDGLLKSVA